MTLNEIEFHFFYNASQSKFSIQQKCNLLVKALPYLKYIARPEAAQCFGFPEDKIPQDMIQKYLTVRKDYDAAEISQIVKEYKNARHSN